MEFTPEEREVIIDALMLMEIDPDTTEEGKRRISEVFKKLGVV